MAIDKIPSAGLDSGAVGVSNLSATGTPSSSTFLRGDNTWSGTITSGTAVSASGTSVDFTGIPSTAKRVTVLFTGLSLNTGGVNPITLRLGTSGGIQASGYTGSQGYVGGPPASTNMSAGFDMYADTAAETLSGAITLQLLNSATNLWVATGIAGNTAAAYMRYIGGYVTLSGALTQIRMTTGNGTATFDAGSINIMWEG